ncbi:MAG: TlpA disulfide reductase family protein [Gammaproteobacteria bacterium]|nr:TlpA disulfide reductase family protein [Gammaproteobacteria bacterium]
MKTSICSIALAIIAPILLGASEESSNFYRIVGEYIAQEAGLEEVPDATASKNANSLDLSTVEIRIIYEIPTDNGETETVELGSDRFVDGRVVFEGEIDEPTDVRISIKELENQWKWVWTTIIPGGEDINFAMVDDGDVRLALVGVSKRVKNPQNKFTISGDLSSIDKDLSRAHVLVTETGVNAGTLNAISSGNMILRNGKFLFEGEAEHPKVVQITVSTLRASGVSDSDSFFEQTSAVVELGAEILIHPQGEHNELVATSGTGKHAKIIESWRQSSEYLELEERFNVAEQEYENKFTALWDAVEAAMKDFNDYAGHVNHEHLALERELAEMRTTKLQSIAKNADDPLDSLLAMEMGAYTVEMENRSEAFQVYDKLTEVLDADLVTQRVTPARERIVELIKIEQNDADLVPGQKVPDFTLSDVEEKETILYDILADNELVLVEFWASWCAPCIAAIPELKDLHSLYNKNGFEIVSVSIDDNFHDWEQASEEQDLPWIDVGEMDGWDGETAKAYGVQFVPKSYLVDREGHILQKDLNPDELEEYVSSWFNGTSSSN